MTRNYNPGFLAETRKQAYVGHSQEVIVLCETGLVKRIPIAIENGVTFDPSVSRISRNTETFILHKSENLGQYASSFSWQSNQFVLLPLSDVPPSGDLSYANGWVRLYGSRDDSFVASHSASVSWNGKSIHVNVRDIPDGFVLIVEGQDESGFKKLSLEYPFKRKMITRSEAEALYEVVYEKTQKGHLKQ